MYLAAAEVLLWLSSVLSCCVVSCPTACVCHQLEQSVTILFERLHCLGPGNCKTPVGRITS